MKGDNQSFEFTVDFDDDGKRLDFTIAEHLEGCSRTLLSRLIRNGKVLVDNRLKKSGYRVKTGERIHGEIPESAPLASCDPEPLPLDIVFQDRHLIIINKKAGMVVHPAPGHVSGTLVNALLYHCPDMEGVGGVVRPGIVHRLDKDTSGILVAAKTHDTHMALSALFREREVKKEYITLVWGDVKRDSGIITEPIGRHPVDRKRMSVMSRRPKEAETLWAAAERFGFATLLNVVIKTGRTHQIRVHCSSMHHPVIGDKVYGLRKPNRSLIGDDRVFRMAAGAPRQMLHARRLSFKHPVTGDLLDFTLPLPDDMRMLVDAFSGAS